jgi:hypothetical protein
MKVARDFKIKLRRLLIGFFALVLVSEVIDPLLFPNYSFWAGFLFNWTMKEKFKC